MKLILVSLLAVFAFSRAAGTEPENILRIWANEYQRSAHAPPPISVTARLKTTKGKHLLGFRLTNISSKPLTVHTGFLPWAYPRGITIAAITTDGTRLRNGYFGEPRGTRLKLLPGKSLEGDYPLSWGLLNDAPKDKDTIVMWLYAMPTDKPYEQWPACTGVIVIPKIK